MIIFGTLSFPITTDLVLVITSDSRISVVL